MLKQLESLWGWLEEILPPALAVIAFGLLFLIVIAINVFIGVLIGTFVGWVVSITPLGAIVEGGFIAIGLNGASGHLTQIGGMLGFVAGFFKGTIECKYTRRKNNGR
ncbi:MAG TPA: hypothetical protein ENG66_04080 [Thermococcus sp.]|nr:hypothetical protein [Thermococcus sp.]